ncbi:alpha/beta fold hydrolase [Isoptericola jiangsuensis]|uniref:alpha/beta fold hydrolase n=1 Tax=Isoptericola jiangsuensis TaxID=548579 RepID=UPI0038658C00
MNPKLLLVHGAWQGAWAWEEVQQRLSDAGHESLAIDLPGSGKDRAPLEGIDLDVYAAAVIAAAKNLLPNPIVLVAHSMGGAVATRAAALEPELFARLVYVCAFAPRDGQSVASLGKLGHELDADTGPVAHISANSLTSTLERSTIEGTFFNDSPSLVDDALLDSFRPQAVAPVTAQMRLSKGFEMVPKAYILCKRDKAIAAPLQRMMADAIGAEVIHELDSGHEPFLTRPSELTSLLISEIGRI